MQRSRARASTSTDVVRTGALLVVHYFGAVLNAHMHLHLCMVDGVVAAGRQRLALSAAQVDEGFVKRNSAAVRRRVK